MEAYRFKPPFTATNAVISQAKPLMWINKATRVTVACAFMGSPAGDFIHAHSGPTRSKPASFQWTTEMLSTKPDPTKHAALDSQASEFQALLEQVYQLSRAEKVHTAGDVIFDLVQGLLRGGDFPACDRLLSMVDITRLKPVLMITFLSTTLTARNRLRARKEYYSRVLTHLVAERGTNRATELLDKYC